MCFTTLMYFFITVYFVPTGPTDNQACRSSPSPDGGQPTRKSNEEQYDIFFIHSNGDRSHVEKLMNIFQKYSWKTISAEQIKLGGLRS